MYNHLIFVQWRVWCGYIMNTGYTCLKRKILEWQQFLWVRYAQIALKCISDDLISFWDNFIFKTENG